MTQTVGIKFVVQNLRDADKAKESWQQFTDTVRKYNTTLKQTQGNMRNVQQQMQILRASTDKLTEAEKEHLRNQKLALIALREIEQEQRVAQQIQREAARERERASKQAAILLKEQQKAERDLRREQEKQTKETEKNTKGWLRNLRTLTLWAAGSASVYLIIRKIRSAFSDTIKTLFENTKEYEKIQTAQDNLKASFVAALGSMESWRKALASTAEIIESVSNTILQAAATLRGFIAMIEAATSDAGALGQLAFAFASLARGDLPGFIAQLELAARTNTDVAQAFLDARDASLSAGGAMQKAYRAANEEAATSKKESKELEKALQRQIKTLERLIEVEKRRVEETLDLLEELRRKEEDLAIDRARAFEDLALDSTRKREDIELKFQRRLEDIRDRAADARAKAEDRLRLRLLAIELRYRERLIRIEEDFQDSIGDAIRTRDATAALQAIRRRSRDIGRATRQRDNDRTLAQANYEAQIRDQERALERQRQEAERARQRALEDLRRDMEREREDILLNQQREIDDLDLFFSRRLKEINDDYETQKIEANEFYTEDKKDYRDYLQDKLDALVNYYNNVVQVAAATRAALAGISMPGGTTSTTLRLGGPQQFAEGGMGFYTSPTTIQVAEARPEIVVAIPIGPSTGGGNLNASVSGQISGVMPGFEGRLSAMMTEAAIGAMSELLQ